MKQKLVFVLALLLFFGCSQKSGQKRPREINFLNNGLVLQTHMIEYDSVGNIVKSRTLKQGNLAFYETFKYGSDGRITESEIFNDQNIMFVKSKFTYDNVKNTKEEKIYDAQGNLAKYYISKYKNGRIQRTDQFYSDKTKYKFVEYSYRENRLDTIKYDEIGAWTMTATCIYDKDNLLTGYSIEHSGLKDRKMESQFKYENGPITVPSWEILLR